MKTSTFLSAIAASIMASEAQLLGIDAPPISLPGQLPLLGNALFPRYNQARTVTLVNTPNGQPQQKLVQAPSTGIASAIYTMSNSEHGNVLIAIPINTTDGTVNKTAPVMHYAMNGTGVRFPFTGTTLQDALDSQGSVVQAGARVFAVNSQSNTLVEFAVNCTNATLLTPIGSKPVSTQGTNPSTIAVAPNNQIVCVANTGNVTGIACFVFDSGFGGSEINGPQLMTGGSAALTLPKAQASPPTGPADTISDLLFTDDETTLIAIVKGAPASNGQFTGGYINSYPITSKGLGTPVTSKPAGTQVLFGCTLVYNTKNMLCSDSAVGAVFLTPTGTNGAYVVAQSTAAKFFGNKTNCWANRSPYQNGADYITAVNGNYIAAFNQNTSTLSSGNYSQHNFTYKYPNAIEMATANNVVYTLSFGTNTTAQHVGIARDTNFAGLFQDLQSFTIPGVSFNVSGMAAFVPSDLANICNFT